MNASDGPPPWQGPRRSGRAKWVMLLVLLAGFGALFLPPVKRKILTLVDRLRTERIVIKKETERVETPVERIVERRVEVPVPPPLPDAPVTGTRKDVSTLFGGVKLESKLVAEPGERATKERTRDDSYAVTFEFKLKVPAPAKTLEDFTTLNPALPVLVPSFKELLAGAKVSGFYHHLYDRKQKLIQTNILRLDRVLTRHNFYDLESVLELEHPGTKQKALLLVGDMDVVSDGSDGDRMESFDDYIFKSQHFQPTTSYAWNKVTEKQNPLIPRLEEELKENKERQKAAGLSNTEKASLKDRAAAIPRLIADLKRRSFLIAQEDPFIVIPLSFRTYRGVEAYAPGIGDYAVVIAGDKMMPAIVGDYGPAEKCGEASLRIAREVNEKSGPYNRAESDLKVTYLIFPNSGDKPAQPDYAVWKTKCGELLTKLGGEAAKLHEWKDRLKKEPPPAPDAEPPPAGGQSGDAPAAAVTPP
jgi:hypothetical protein